MSQHTQFQLDGTDYQISSNCPQQLFPVLNDRIIKFLQRHGKETAQGMFGVANAEGATRIDKTWVKFKLTINPEGIQL